MLLDLNCNLKRLAETIQPRKERRGAYIDFVERSKDLRSRFSRNDNLVQPWGTWATLIARVKQKRIQAILER